MRAARVLTPESSSAPVLLCPMSFIASHCQAGHAIAISECPQCIYAPVYVCESTGHARDHKTETETETDTEEYLRIC